MSSARPAFRDREEAGRRLARAIAGHCPDRPVVLALPRGGVPVAHEIAQALGADLDLLFVRKLGAPGHEEFGIGAVIDGAHPQTVLNDEIVRELSPGSDYIRNETARQLREIDRRRREYLGDRKPIDLTGRNVILVDDGIATGGTVRAALKGLRRARAGKILLAVPVAPPDALRSLANECDEIICLLSPYPFYAVGVHYADFRQTSDEEVKQLLAGAARTEQQPPPSSPAV
ncbi:phosphoribosyltransferase [Sphingobium nicotianae]|uniref:Phosphoribosyltransferase n=1 Tax=Sphingobium nicotianae TaxID=2782607 RepID=A0A9X1D9Y5_9SPHN|nr:phosphoribosyltransferase [Sphingobium nicotianae]MBT2186109.1 phosphoribosyltransferase [Sphingobium nicotianae]